MLRARWLARLIKMATNRKINSKPDFVIGGDYLRRWWVIPRNRFFNIYLHEICRSDDDRALHDHPWWNVSFVLDGSMLEIMPSASHFPIGQQSETSCRSLNYGALVYRKASAAHRLEVRDGETCRTLFITGPRIREWGFHCPQGWRHWKDFTGFHETGDSTSVGRGCGEL